MIALIDSGVDPSFDVFRTELGKEPFRRLGIEYQLIDPVPMGGETSPNDAFWDAIEPGVLYAFPGTRLMGIAFEKHERPLLRDVSRHGAQTAFLAASEAPMAVIVAISVDIQTCAAPACLDDATAADAMEWAAAQPWIDIVSVSLGVLGNIPESPLIRERAERYSAASRAAAETGKVVLSAAGNTFVPSIGHFYPGPPWVIAVGGAQTYARGEAWDASRGVDVVSDYSVLAPTDSGELEWREGTSFATPLVAGTVGLALEIARSAGTAPSGAALREALNASAVHWRATDWDGAPPGRTELPWDVLRYQSLPIVAQPQMGWGYVNGSLAPEIARRVIEGDYSIPPSKSQAMAFQPAWQRAREEFWARWPG